MALGGAAGPEEENCGPQARWGPLWQAQPLVMGSGVGQGRACRKEDEWVRKV